MAPNEQEVRNPIRRVRAAHDDVQDGAKLKDTLALNGVSPIGFLQCYERNGLGTRKSDPKVMPTVVQFKEVERKIRQHLSIPPVICKKHARLAKNDSCALQSQARCHPPIL